MLKIKKIIKSFFSSITLLIYNFYFKQNLIYEKVTFAKNFFLEKKKHFIIFIDRSHHAVNYNYLDYLLYARLISLGKKAVIVILPEHQKKQTHSKDFFIKNTNDLRFETILKGLLQVIYNFNATLIFCNERSDAMQFFSYPSDQKFPKNASYENSIYQTIIPKDVYAKSKALKTRLLIKAPNFSHQLVKNIFLKDLNKKIITISIRHNFQKNIDSRQSYYRNSELDVWLNFADWVKKNTDFCPIFIPDIEMISLNSSLFKDHLVFCEAALDIKLRVAIYELAHINLTVAAGFTNLLFHSLNNFLVYKVGDTRVKFNGAGSFYLFEKSYGIKKNDQLPFAHANQKIFWGEKTEKLTFIKKTFLDYLKDYKKN